MSGFKKGHAKVGGRQKGSQNKRKVARVADYLSENGIDPIAKMRAILESGKLSPSAEFDGWLELQSYCEAKPKEIEKDDAGDLLDDVGEVSEETILKLINSETA